MQACIFCLIAFPNREFAENDEIGKLNTEKNVENPRNIPKFRCNLFYSIDVFNQFRFEFILVIIFFFILSIMFFLDAVSFRRINLNFFMCCHWWSNLQLLLSVIYIKLKIEIYLNQYVVFLFVNLYECKNMLILRPKSNKQMKRIEKINISNIFPTQPNSHRRFIVHNNVSICKQFSFLFDKNDNMQ